MPQSGSACPCGKDHPFDPITIVVTTCKQKHPPKDGAPAPSGRALAGGGSPPETPSRVASPGAAPLERESCAVCEDVDESYADVRLDCMPPARASWSAVKIEGCTVDPEGKTVSCTDASCATVKISNAIAASKSPDPPVKTPPEDLTMTSSHHYSHFFRNVITQTSEDPMFPPLTITYHRTEEETTIVFSRTRKDMTTQTSDDSTFFSMSKLEESPLKEEEEYSFTRYYEAEEDGDNTLLSETQKCETTQTWFKPLITSTPKRRSTEDEESMTRYFDAHEETTMLSKTQKCCTNTQTLDEHSMFCCSSKFETNNSDQETLISAQEYTTKCMDTQTCDDPLLCAILKEEEESLIKTSKVTFDKVDESVSVDQSTISDYESVNADVPILPVMSERYHGPGCAMEICIMEKHDHNCKFRKRKNKDRNPIDDRCGDYDVVGRMSFRTCGSNRSNNLSSGFSFQNETQVFSLHVPITMNFYKQEDRLMFSETNIDTLMNFFKQDDLLQNLIASEKNFPRNSSNFEGLLENVSFIGSLNNSFYIDKEEPVVIKKSEKSLQVELFEIDSRTERIQKKWYETFFSCLKAEHERYSYTYSDDISEDISTSIGSQANMEIYSRIL